MIYPKVEITEVYQLKPSLKPLLAADSKFAGQVYFEMKEARDLVQRYIQSNRLDRTSEEKDSKPLKGGQVRLNPVLYSML